MGDIDFKPIIFMCVGFFVTVPFAVWEMGRFNNLTHEMDWKALELRGKYGHKSI